MIGPVEDAPLWELIDHIRYWREHRSSSWKPKVMGCPRKCSYCGMASYFEAELLRRATA